MSHLNKKEFLEKFDSVRPQVESSVKRRAGSEFEKNKKRKNPPVKRRKYVFEKSQQG